MPLRGVITYVGSPEATAKELKKSVKEELIKIIEFWHKKYLPRHFTTAGGRDYKYQPRSKKYMIRKARRFHHQLPLVYTGDLKRMLSRTIKITTTSKGAKGSLMGPQYLYAYRKDYNQPDKAAEVTVTLPKEVNIFAKLLDRKITRRLNKVTKKETRRF